MEWSLPTSLGETRRMWFQQLCLLGTPFRDIQTGLPWGQPCSPPLAITCTHPSSDTTYLPPLPWALSSVLATGGASERLHLPIHFEFPLNWHLGFKTFQSTVNRAFVLKRERERKRKKKSSQEVKESKDYLKQNRETAFFLSCFFFFSVLFFK